MIRQNENVCLELVNLPPPVAQRTVDIFLNYLKAEEIRLIFGIPGGLVHPFFEAIENDPYFKLIVTRHEEGAAFMADGYGRATRRLAVCAGTSGPGSTNLLTGVACAFADSIPMLVITGQAASPVMGKGAAQETTREDIDIVGMFRPVTKYSAMVTSQASLPHHLRRALRLALTGRPAPVHLNIPVDLWDATITETWVTPETYRPMAQSFDWQSVEEANSLLLKANYPVLLVGSGVAAARAEKELMTLAEMLPARVATTPKAKGVFPEDHPLSLGVFGVAGHREARETILGPEIDVLLAIGTSLNETATLNFSPQFKRPRVKLVQADIEAEHIGRVYPFDLALVGDAKTILRQLKYSVDQAASMNGSPQSRWNEALPLCRTEERYSDSASRLSLANPVTPPRWRQELAEVLPTNAIIFSDIGGHMLFNLHHLCVRQGQRFFINLGFGSMGHGTVAPIGAALGTSDPVFAIVGDGCFTMNGMELLTAAEYGAKVIWIVENNNMHGITYHGSQKVGSKKPMECIRFKHKIEVARIAEAMGVPSFLVEKPGEIKTAVLAALHVKGPSVIEVRADARHSPPLGDRAKTLAGFINK